MIDPMLLECLLKSSHDAKFLVSDLQETLKRSHSADPALSILILDLIETAAKLEAKVSQVSNRYERAKEEEVTPGPDAMILAVYPDPYIVKDGSVFVLRHSEKDLCNAPLSVGGTYFLRDELAEVYANDLIGQPEIDALIASLQPTAPEGDEKTPAAALAAVTP